MPPATPEPLSFKKNKSLASGHANVALEASAANDHATHRVSTFAVAAQLPVQVGELRVHSDRSLKASYTYAVAEPDMVLEDLVTHFGPYVGAYFPDQFAGDVPRFAVWAAELDRRIDADPANGMRIRGDELRFTNHSIHWDWPDNKLRRAVMGRSVTTERLATGLEDVRRRLERFPAAAGFADQYEASGHTAPAPPLATFQLEVLRQGVKIPAKFPDHDPLDRQQLALRERIVNV